jgi:hypothetical protein
MYETHVSEETYEFSAFAVTARQRWEIFHVSVEAKGHSAGV